MSGSFFCNILDDIILNAVLWPPLLALTPTPALISNCMQSKVWIELLIHSQTSTVRPLKFGEWLEIIPHTLYWVPLLVHFGIRVLHVSKTGPSFCKIQWVVHIIIISQCFSRWLRSRQKDYTLSNLIWVLNKISSAIFYICSTILHCWLFLAFTCIVFFPSLFLLME